MSDINKEIFEILLLSADAAHVEAVSTGLKTSQINYDLVVTASEEEGLGILEEAVFDLILFDSLLGKDDASESLEKLSKRSLRGEIILLVDDEVTLDKQKGLPESVADCLSFDRMSRFSFGRMIEEALHRSQQSRMRKLDWRESDFRGGLLRQVIDATKEPMLLLDKSLKILLFNKAASLLLEIGSTSLEGEIFPFDLTVGKDEIFEIPVAGDSQRQFRLELIEFDEPDEIRMLIILHEISPSELNESSAIPQKEQRIDEGHESTNHLAGGIAHDFNNILTAVLGNITMTRMALGDSHSEFDKLISAEKAIHQAKDLTQQLLHLSRGSTPFIEATTMDELVRECADLILRGSNVGYRLFVESEIWAVDADKGQIRQVINNLIINADQAMSEGGALTLKLKNMSVRDGEVPSLTSGSYVRLSLSDTGPGMTPEDLKKIFDPYFTTKESGNGLGLASSLSIIQRHSGTISVDSVFGCGATFHVYLPKSSSGTIPANTEPVNEGETDLLHRGSGRILIMDDMESMKYVAGEMLSLLGYDVTLTKDGREAIDAYREAMAEGAPFRAVIFDLTVPGGMGGEEACRILRGMDPNLISIASSGYSTSNIMSDWESYGFNAFVAKPYRIKDIGRVLDQLLNG